MARAELWIAAVLGFAVVVSAIAVVHTKYLTRVHFAQLQDLRAQRDAIDVEWNRLRLEEAALSTHSRIERIVREQLGMFSPRPGDVLLLEETGHGQP
ncbi:cell division protein FtsL [Marichromatium purpuratum 984]|uniref:Cell division protein FtsL n=1 Tax=Marichromatium purpuratum 984 TaxID=765910 RepID=W0E2B3_MARPU|nr:cell division protein FtsL [Marichromatium purpuratum]AHF04882.1 cell division protein FtsL [Marichromatium purpuratum 984]